MEAPRRGGRVDGALALILHPLCLILFRLMIFDTLPRDDYAPMLLWWLGQPGAVPPTSPYGYRVLSMLAAVPFYHLLPPFALTNLPGNLTPRICARHRGARGGLVRGADGECRHGVPAGGRPLRARAAGRHLRGAVRSGGAALRVAVRRRSAGDLRRRAGAVFRRARVRFRRDPGRVGDRQREDRDPVRGLADDPLRAARG